jgi:hypothetical protein
MPSRATAKLEAKPPALSTSIWIWKPWALLVASEFKSSEAGEDATILSFEAGRELHPVKTLWRSSTGNSVSQSVPCCAIWGLERISGQFHPEMVDRELLSAMLDSGTCSVHPWCCSN